MGSSINVLICFHFPVLIEPIQITIINSEARYSRSTESGPIDVDIPQCSDRDEPIR